MKVLFVSKTSEKRYTRQVSCINNTIVLDGYVNTVKKVVVGPKNLIEFNIATDIDAVAFCS